MSSSDADADMCAADEPDPEQPRAERRVRLPSLGLAARRRRTVVAAWRSDGVADGVADGVPQAPPSVPSVPSVPNPTHIPAHAGEAAPAVSSMHTSAPWVETSPLGPEALPRAEPEQGRALVQLPDAPPQEAERGVYTLIAHGTAAGSGVPRSTGLWWQHRPAAAHHYRLVLVVLVATAILAASPLGSHALSAWMVGDGPRPGVEWSQVQTPGVPSGPWESSAAAVSLGSGGGAGPGVSAPGSAGGGSAGAWSAPTPTVSAPGSYSGSDGSGGVSPAPFQPWPPANPWMPVAGHPAYRINQASGYYPDSFGQCTWWSSWSRRDEHLVHMGNARWWVDSARARGMRVGTVPVANSTVVFQPGVEGAGGGGHVAHVERVYPDGWFLISEMNFYWNGGRWGWVDWRYVYVTRGVAFIY